MYIIFFIQKTFLIMKKLDLRLDEATSVMHATHPTNHPPTLQHPVFKYFRVGKTLNGTMKILYNQSTE